MSCCLWTSMIQQQDASAAKKALDEVKIRKGQFHRENVGLSKILISCRCSKKLSAHRRLCRVWFHVSSGSVRRILPFSSRGKRALERNWSPVPSTSAHNDR